MKVALFDFDGTLYPHETFETLRAHLKDHPKFKKNYKHFVRHFAPTYFGYKMKLVPKIKMQHRALESYVLSFKGYSKKDIDGFFADVAKSMSTELRTTLLEKIKELKDENYYVVLISGALFPYWNRYLKVLVLIILSGRRFTTRVKHSIINRGLNVFLLTAKLILLREHFKNKEVDWKNSQAYSDSITDIKMLELVGQPVAVTRITTYYQSHKIKIGKY